MAHRQAKSDDIQVPVLKTCRPLIDSAATSSPPATEEQAKIAFQLGLKPNDLAHLVALKRAIGDRSPYTSFSTRQLREHSHSLHSNNPGTDDPRGLVQALLSSATTAMQAYDSGDNLSVQGAVRDAAATCAALIECYRD